MATAESVISIALGEVGYSRWSDPEQGTKYGRWYASKTGAAYYAQNGVPYCAMFVSWVFAQAGQACAGLPGAYCPDMLDQAESAGATVPISQATAGDLVYYDWNGGESDHVGIVIANHGSYLETVEGNTSTGSGSQTNGGVVARRKRSLDYVCGIVRPLYSEGSQESGALDVDGYLGPLSVAEWQRQCGLEQTGVVSGQLTDCRRWYPHLTSVTFEGTGSPLMREVQERAGVPNPSGIIARGSMCKLQGMLVLWGYDIADAEAGVLGEHTAKAIQRSLNDGRWRD